MRAELKNLISFTRGPAAWDELLATEGDIRKKRQKAIYDQQERQRKVIEAIMIVILMVVILGFIGGVTWMFMQTRGMV